MQGLSEVERNKIRLLNNKIEACPNQACDNTPPEDPVYNILANALAYGVASHEQQPHNDANNIHQPIPAQGHRANVHNYRVDIDVDVCQHIISPMLLDTSFKLS